MSIFVASFIVLSVGCVVAYLSSKHTAHGDPNNKGFRRFQRMYLTVYLTAQGADWLQGPHVYALFSSYGLTPKQINQLFVVGFGSSMIFGTVVGSFADRAGRKFNCVLYGILYGADCLSKHIPNYWVLICGRLMGGVATSILFSAFESWLLCEHEKRGFSKDLLSDLFSNAVLGNGLVAILAGVVAQAVAIQYGFVAPFTLSLLLLIMVSVIVCSSWTENYGDTSGSVKRSLLQGIQVIRKDPKVFCLGLTQSLFEGSMYCFVLEWTPALTPASQLGMKRVEDNIPHGLIFATFMVAVMIGSRVFKLLSKVDTVESFMRPVFATAALSLATPIIVPQNQTAIFVGFLVFECCVGIFWPALGVLRGKYVPETTRATVMNIFRVPLNMIVIAMLVQDLARSTVFCCCVIFLIFCCAIQQHLCYLCQDHNNQSTNGLEGEPAMENGHITAGPV